MMDEPAIYAATIYFSYSQFFVLDRSVELPGCDWTDEHVAQGFARRPSTVSFATMLEFGHADLKVYFAPYEARDHHERVIEVPIEVSSGKVEIGGPEESSNRTIVKLPDGHYRLVAAQTVTADDREDIDLSFERLTAPLARSRILVADDALEPPDPLVETAEVA